VIGIGCLNILVFLQKIPNCNDQISNKFQNHPESFRDQNSNGMPVHYFALAGEHKAATVKAGLKFGICLGIVF